MTWKNKNVLSISFRNGRFGSDRLWVLSLVFTTLVVTAAGGSLLASPSLNETATATSDVRTFLGPEGKVIPLKTDEEIENFLLTAEVVKLEDLGIGVANARRAYLERNGIRARACFRDVDIHRRQGVLPRIRC